MSPEFDAESFDKDLEAFFEGFAKLSPEEQDELRRRANAHAAKIATFAAGTPRNRRGRRALAVMARKARHK